MEQVIDFRDIATLEGFSSTFCKRQESYVFVNVTPESSNRLKFDNVPMRFKGMLMILMRGGTPFKLEMDREEVELRPNSYLVATPSTVMRFSNPIPKDIEAYLLFVDLSFAENINFDHSAIPIPSKFQKPDKTMVLKDDEVMVLNRYFELINLTTITESNEEQINKCISTSLIAAMFYQTIQFYYKRAYEILRTAGDTHTTMRRNDYVHDFLRLLRDNYAKERSVTFYADKLFISPKYLSLLVKEATGSSAAKWIDNFVLIEAKNMLRYSGKNIQQVAYALNFPTQSSFGKYFKHLTGMSPTEYQRS